MARRSSALACAIFLSALAWSIWRKAPIFLPTSISAISIERISKAVPESRPLPRTSFEMLSGFSSTDLWIGLTRWMKRSPHLPWRVRFLRRASHQLFDVGTNRHPCLAMSWIPSFATAVTDGVSITFGLTDIFTASRTSRPARSMQ